MRPVLPLFLIAMAAPAGAGPLACPGGAGHIPPAVICTAVADALGARSAPGLRLEIMANDAQRLAARLIWTGGQGPLIEVTANSGALQERAAGRLAQGLAGSTDLP